MTDWFIDAAAAGTGTGLSAANAATNVISFSPLAINSYLAGDRIWVRRTQITIQTTGTALRFGANLTWNQSSQQYTGVIGWPLSGEPFYDLRPGDARSAGWDADVASAIAGINKPTIVFSNTNGTHPYLYDGNYIANFVIVNSTSGVSQLDNNNFTSNRLVPKFNLHLLNVYPMNSWNAVWGLTVTASRGAVNAFFDGYGIFGGVTTITASSVLGSGSILDNNSNNLRMEDLNILSSSMSTLYKGGTSTSVQPGLHHVKRVRGTIPYSGDAGYTSGNQYGGVCVIDEYFGQGPRQIAGFRQRYNYTADSATAQFMGELPFAMESRSGNITTFPSYNYFGTGEVQFPHARARINATSGVPLVLRWPIARGYGSLDVLFTKTNMPQLLSVPGLGSSVVTSLETGSSAAWSGSFTNSALFYNVKADFVPTETNSYWAELWINPGFTRAGVIYAAPRPDVASA